MTPAQRASAWSRSTEASRRAQLYRRQQDGVKAGAAAGGAAVADEDAATARIRKAQAERVARLRAEHEIVNPYEFTGGGGVTNPAFEARFQQMERDGEFESLCGAGQPLPERPHTHFNDDAMQGILNGMLANANYKPESLEARASYLGALGKFRTDLSAVLTAGTLDGRARADFEQRLEALRGLLRQFDNAALKDAELLSLPKRDLPRVGDLDAETRACALEPS